MNILVICHYGLYQNLESSFVHNQVREYTALGHRVRVVIPIGIGKTGADGSRIFPGLRWKTADGAELCYLRYLTLSSYGEKGFNTQSAISAVRMHSKAILGDFKPDIIHAHTLGFDSGIGTWLKKRLQCPLVVTTHGSDTSVPLEQGRLEHLRKCCDGADRVMAVSSVLADSLRSCGTKTRIGSILNGFNASNVLADEQKIPLRVVQVSNLLKQKRVYITVEAFAKLKQKYPQATLKIIGSGVERDNLEKQCLDLGISDCVEFTGRIPNRQTMEEMAKAQFFVMPSVREGFGIVYLEAMSSGCITIGTRGEGIQDLIVDGENGFLVPPDDPDQIVGVIKHCINWPEQADQIAAKGTAAAQKLTWRNNALQYIALFEKLRKGE